MRAANTQVINEALPVEQQVPVLRRQIEKLYRLLQGRVSFGTGVSGVDGQNIEGQFKQFTTSATPNAENTISHTVGSVPIGRIVLWQDKAGSLYQGPSTGTAWTSTNVYMKCDIASVTFLIFIVKKGSITSG